MLECFKAGLKPEIEQRIRVVATVNDIVKQAIKTEKLLVARKALRRSKNNTEIAARKKLFIANYVNNQDMKLLIVCNRPGHKSKSCNLLDNKPNN